jgi:hypothetical protein
MADEQREVTIVIRGKNLTQAEFAAARKELAGVDDQAKKLSASTVSLGSAFKVMGAAFSIGAVTSAITSYADLTGELTDLSAKTGIGVEALQRLKYAAEQNGGSLDQVTGAVTKLGANLAGGSQSAVGALDALGLSFGEIRSMAPDKAFTTIADSIAKIHDPMAQSRIAMDLFGKSGAELLPMMKGNLSETAAAADALGIVLSEDAVRAGDEFGDTMGTLGSVGKAVIAQVLEPMIPVLTTVAKWMGETLPGAVRFITDALSTGLSRAFLDTKILFNEFLLGIAEGVNSIPLLGEKIGFSSETIAGLRGNLDDAKAALDIFTRQTVANSVKQDAAAKTITTLSLAYGENEKAVGKAAAAAEKARLAATIWGDGLSDFDHLMADHNITIGDYVTAQDLAERAAADTNDQLEYLGGTAITIGPVIDNSLTSPWGRFVDAVEASGPKTARSFDAMGGAFKNLGNTILSAVQGGGSVVQSIGSSFGQALGKDIAGNLKESFSIFGSKALGGAFATMLPGLGALIGPLIGKIGSLFTSKNTQEVKTYNLEIGKVRDNLLQTYGPLDELEAKAQSVGLSFKDAWGHEGKVGLEAFSSLADTFKSRWDEVNGSLDTSRGTLDELMKRGSDLGYTFDQSGKLVNVSTEKMREVAQKFGLDIKALGPSFDQAGLRTRMQDVIDGFTLMDKGGTETGTILMGMKDEINAVVNDSRKFKTEIPENMRPWIKNLIDTGQLTDENGDKIEDLAGIKFGAPVQSEFDKISKSITDLIGSIQTLVDRIGGIAKAASDIPQVEAPWAGWGEPPDIGGVAAAAASASRASSSAASSSNPWAGMYDANGDGRNENGYSVGTFGRHGYDFPDFGNGTRVVVHNREAIVPYDERLEFARRQLGDAPANVTVNPSITVELKVAVDPQSGKVRMLGEAERAQIQDWLSSGSFQVPQRVISQRTR